VPAAWSPWVSRAPVALLVAIASLVAWIEGGGAAARVPPPRPEVTSPEGGPTSPSRARGGGAESTPGAANGPSSPDHAGGADAYQVRVRLVEALGDAVIDVPSLAASQPFFQAHWRKLRGPWAHAAGVAGQLVTTIALRTSPQVETQWEGSSQSGPWTPDVRVWNMNEGSFDQREAIYAPTPATLRFRVTIPPGARLRFSPAVATPLPATTLFGVAVIDVAGGEQYVSQTRVPPADDRRWLDADVDLGPWSGQKVELQLRTWMEKPADNERRWSPPTSSDPLSDDANAAEQPSVPPMALALWGDPVIVAKERTRAPYNVVWIVVDAMRPDIAASLHDPAEDAAKLAALRPPLDALLPAIPGLMPAVDRLAARGVHFTHAWSVGSWTRPGTLAMLTGERSSELGIDTTNWVQPVDRVSRYYASEPPLLPRLLRKGGVTTAAFVNNFFMTGYAVVGLDMGFERITDHRYRTRDTALITYDALAWLEAHANTRFFLFVNYNSPHGPYDPPKEMLARIPPPPAGPRDAQVRAYMAEAAKDDTAIGVLFDKLEALGLTESTLVVITSDHGETLSAAHDGYGLIGADRMPMRFHHAVGNFEETTRIPLVMALPGVIDGGRAVRDRVRNIDIAPTVLELEGLEADTRMSGLSLLPLVRGRKEPEARLVVTEGRLSRSALWGKWRMVVHEAPPHPAMLPDGGAPPPLDDELYDLDEDPGERRNVGRQHAGVMTEMRARLADALASGTAPDARQRTTSRADRAAAETANVQSRPPATVHLRFAGAGRIHGVSGSVTVGDAKHPATVVVEPVGVTPETVKASGRTQGVDRTPEGTGRTQNVDRTPEGTGRTQGVDLTFSTSPDAVVGFDLRVDPPGAPIAWQLFLDGAPWPDGATFVGSFGLSAVAASAGIATDEARAESYAPTLPVIDPARDLGVFVTCDRAEKVDEPTGDGPAATGEAAKEMQRMLQQWGYAHGSH
jgi:arylsulfatase A-like enzyme